MNTAIKWIQKPLALPRLLHTGNLPVNGVLIMAILITAIAIIAKTNQYRVSFSEYELLLKQHRQLRLQKNQLLTEQTFFTRHDRIKSIAKDALAMKAPDLIQYV